MPKGLDSLPKKSRLIRISLFGPPTWRRGADSARLRGHDAAILALLAIDGPRSRDALAAMLWPKASHDQQKSLQSLRNRSSTLSKRVGQKVITVGDTVQLEPGVDFDVWLDPAECDPSLLLQRRPFLEGVVKVGGSALNKWVADRRKELASSAAFVLDRHAEALVRQHDHAHALEFSRRAVDMDPGLEPARVRIMRLQVKSGDARSALQEYEALRVAKLREQQQPGIEASEMRASAELAAEGHAPDTEVLRRLRQPDLLVGRHIEWQSMRAAWEVGTPVMLLGEPGIGKSMLLQHFLRNRRHVVHVDARAGDEHSANAVLSRLLRAVLRAHPVAVDPFHEQLLRRLSLKPGPQPETPAGEEHVLRTAVEELLVAAIAAGLVGLAVDNLHQSDLASVQTFRWLTGATSLAKLRFIFALRDEQPEPIRQEIEDWRIDPSRPEVLHLRSLSNDGTEALIEAIRIPGVDTRSLSRPLHRLAGGQPFFTLALIRSWILAGGTRPLSKTSWPATVTQLLDHSLGQVSGELKEVLQLAALLGGDLEVPRLAKILRRSRKETDQMLDQLIAFGLLSDRDHFVHDLMRERALQHIGDSDSLHLHTRIAAIAVRDITIRPARRAHYCAMAHLWRQAARALMEASREARGSSRLLEEQEFLEQAARCWERLDDKVAAFHARRCAAESTLLLKGPEVLRRTIDDMARHAPDALQQVDLQVLLANSLLQSLQIDESLRIVDDLLDLRQARGTQALDAVIIKTTAHAMRGEGKEALEAYEHAMALARAKSTDRQRTKLTHLRAVVMYFAGRLQDAITAARESNELAVAMDDIVESVEVEGNLCTMLQMAGDTAGVYEVAKRLRPRHAHLGTHGSSAPRLMNLINLGNSAAHLGHFVEAEEALRMAASEPAAAEGLHHIGCIARMSLAYVWLTLGSASRARRVLPTLASITQPGMRMRWHWVQAQIAQREGRSDCHHLERIAQEQTRVRVEGLGETAWLEWSRHSVNDHVVAQLLHVRDEHASKGHVGVANGLTVRIVQMLLELGSAAAVQQALGLARTLDPDALSKLGAFTYVPEALSVLAQTRVHDGDKRGADRLRLRAREWVEARADALPVAWQHSFRWRNPLNRDVLGQSSRGATRTGR